MQRYYNLGQPNEVMEGKDTDRRSFGSLMEPLPSRRTENKLSRLWFNGSGAGPNPDRVVEFPATTILKIKTRYP